MSGRPNPGRAGAVGVAVLALGLVTVSCGSTVPVPTSAQSAPPGAPAAGGGLSVPTGTTTNGSSAGPSFHGAGGAVGGGTNAGTTGVGGGTSGGTGGTSGGTSTGGTSTGGTGGGTRQRSGRSAQACCTGCRPITGAIQGAAPADATVATATVVAVPGFSEITFTAESFASTTASMPA